MESRNIYNIIGSNIRSIRMQRGITSLKLSKICNLSHGYIKNLESQKVYATISIETLGIIAKALNVNIIDFFENL